MKFLSFSFLIFLSICSFSLKAQTGYISTYAGNGSDFDSGDGGSALLAGINRPYCAVFDSKGNLFTVQLNTHRVRMISYSGVITTFAGTGIQGFSGDGGLAINAQVNSPRWVDVDRIGNIYIADGGNKRIRKVDTNGIITTIAGNGNTGYNGEGISALSADMVLPTGIDFDSIGNIYVCENARIRKIDTFGIITTVVGTGTPGYSGDGGSATAAQIQAARVYIDPFGNIVIVDYYRIRRVDAVTGIITTIAGTGVGAYNGDEIQALAANINTVALAWDKLGAMYIADMGNDRVRMIDANNIIHTIAGTGVAGYSGDGGLATLAQIFDPTGVAFDTCGNLYIPCKENHNIRKITFNDSCGTTNTNTINKQTQSIHIFPNPAHSQISITASIKLNETTITNTLGQVVLHQSVNKEKAEISISHLHPGIYFVTIIDANGEKVVKKIVKE